jgi:hypothetical protein
VAEAQAAYASALAGACPGRAAPSGIARSCACRA